MKITCQEIGKKVTFKPFSITITFDSEREVIDLLGDLDCDSNIGSAVYSTIQKGRFIAITK